MTLIEVVIALAITGLMLGGIISGYIYCTTAAMKAELVQAASARALERLEETRSAQWNTAVYPVVDQLVAANFSNVVVSLDTPGTNLTGTAATIVTTISQISSNPPIRNIRVDCIWQFRRTTDWVTNTFETIRAPDQ